MKGLLFPTKPLWFPGSAKVIFVTWKILNQILFTWTTLLTHILKADESFSFQLLTSWQGMNTKLHWQRVHFIWCICSFNILLFDIFFKMFLFFFFWTHWKIAFSLLFTNHDWAFYYTSASRFKSKMLLSIVISTQQLSVGKGEIMEWLIHLLILKHFWLV